MSKDYWKEVLDTARKRLETLRSRRDELDAEREEINLEVVQTEQLVEHLTPLATGYSLETRNPFRVENITELNLADACREILKKSNTHITPIQVRDALVASGYNLNQYSNPLASIHGVLKRMAESGEVESLAHEKRGTMYRWKAPIQPSIPRSPKPTQHNPLAGITMPDMSDALKAATAIDKRAFESINKSAADALAKVADSNSMKAATDAFSKMSADTMKKMADVSIHGIDRKKK